MAIAPAADRSRIPIATYPVALATAFILELFVESGISPFAILRSLVLAILIAVALSLACRVALGDRDRAGTVTCLLVLLLIGGADGRVAGLAALASGLIVFERVATRRRPVIRWRFVGRFLTMAATVLFVAIGIQAIQFGTPQVIVRALTSEAPFHASRDVLPSSTERPDIYLILLDGFARRDVLEEVFELDGAPFVSGLEDRGLSVSTHSRSSYAITFQTLSSLFHMRPVQEIETFQPLLNETETRPEEALMREAINDGPALDVLRGLGYDIHSIASGWEGTALRQADVWTDTGELNEFELVIIRRSILSPILRAVAPDYVSSQHRSRIESVLRSLEDKAGATSDRPRFIFGHVPSPHVPWVHHADGSPRTAHDLDDLFAEERVESRISFEELRAGYAGQVTWLSGRVLSTVDRIQARSERPAVIVLFSDHGTWIGAQGDDIGRRFQTLLAGMGPDGEPLFPDRVATVDMFPILFRRLFDREEPTHPDTPSYVTGIHNFDLRAIPDPD